MATIAHDSSFRRKFLHLKTSFRNKFLQLKTSFREKLLQLQAKHFYDSDAPKTIIGDAIYLSMLGTQSRDQLMIQKVNLDVDIEAGLVAFFSFAYGPWYRSREQNHWKQLKRNAWEHVLFHTSDIIESDTETKRDAVTRLYIEAVKKAAEDGGRSFYVPAQGRISSSRIDGNSLDEISTDAFIWMMVIDGCFFLQIALILLGGSGPLMGVPFLQPAVNRVSILKAAASSMFVVGNQIPLVVLRALMGQSFFKEAIHSGIWEQPSDLERLALFELLLVPAAMNLNVSDVNLTSNEGGHRALITIPTALFLDNQHVLRQGMHYRRSSRSTSLQASSSRATSLEESSSEEILKIVKGLCASCITSSIKEKINPLMKADDVLNGLRMLLVGPMWPGEPNFRVVGNIHSKTDHSVLLPAIPSATQLKEMGIVFQYSESTRVDKISLKKVMFSASLHLPRIVIDFDNNIETLLKNLIRYEVMHLDESSWTMCEYLTFLRELIRSPEDVAVLTSSGIIVADPYQESRVPVLFRDLGIPRMKHYRLRKVRDKLINYTRPSPYKKVRDVLTIVLLLGLIQTVFSVLAYFHQKA